MRRAVAAGAVILGVLVTPAPAGARTEQPVREPASAVAAEAYGRMNEAQRIGQLFVAGVNSGGASNAKLAMLHGDAIGSAILYSATTGGRGPVKRVSRSLVSNLSVAGVAPFVGTDQEGGEVQRLEGRGFSRIPAALTQGSWRPGRLRTASMRWGEQLVAAGVDLDLAPVADTVPAKHASRNAPIGRYHREFGHTPRVVASHAVAFARGMNAAGVATSVKHFPGLGRASGDTDTDPHVTDPTTRNDPYLRPFRAAISAGAQFVMVSSATYPQIDPARQACFSPTIIRSMLRGDLNFRGVVVSDDLAGSELAGTPVPRRALRFLKAGGTMLVDTSASQVPTMARAVRREVAADPGFARTVKAAVLMDLAAKANAGLISTS